MAKFQPAPKSGIIMNGTYKIKIMGCRYRNDAVGIDTFFDSQYKRGNGIVANSAVFLVSDYCATPPCALPIQCEFSNLEHGVKALCGDYIKPFSVRNAIFTDNFCGIRSEGSLIGPVIRECDFYVHDLDDNSDGNTNVIYVLVLSKIIYTVVNADAYKQMGQLGAAEIGLYCLCNRYNVPAGINMDNTTGFHIQENNFYDITGGEGPSTIGIALENTALSCLSTTEIQETASNLIYRNTFEGLDIAINVEGENQVEDIDNPQESYGLEFRCNKFGQAGSDCTKDFNLYAGATVQKSQGSYNLFGAAGNLFYDNDCDYDYEHWDAGLNTTYVEAYYHNPNTASLTLKPDCSDGLEIHPIETPFAYSSSICPIIDDPNTKPHLVPLNNHDTQKSAMIDTQNIFHGLMDGGNIENLKALILNPNSESSAIRNELLELSPNISDIIWQSCFDRVPAMNPWHLTQVLLSASPLRNEVLLMMKDSGLAEYYRDMVTNGQLEGITEKEIFESDIATSAQRANQERQDYLRSYMLSEENESVNVDTPVLNFLEDNNADLDRYIHASILQDKGDFTGAFSVLNGCIQTSPQKDYYRVLQILIESKQTHNFPTLNVSHLVELENIALNENSCGNAQARALLHRFDGREFPMDIEYEVINTRNLRESKKVNSVVLYSIQPNPANETLWITYPHNPEIGKIHIHLIDVLGRDILDRDISSSKGIYELTTSSIPSGAYLLQLTLDAIDLGFQKVNIQH